MNTEVANALSALRVDPEDRGALETLRAAGKNNGVGADGSAATLAAARAYHEDRGDIDVCLQLIDAELEWGAAAVARADLLAERGRLLFIELLRKDDAVGALQEALDLVPDHEVARRLLDMIERETTSWEATARESRERVESADALTAAAELISRHRPGDADVEVLLRRALEREPTHRRALALWERLLSASGREAELEAALAAALAAAPPEDKPGFEARLGRLFARGGRAAEAHGAFERALSANPIEPVALAGIARVLGEAGDWSSLVKVYEAAVRAAARKPGSEMPYLVVLGDLHLLRLGDMDQAELQYRKARKLQPHHPQVLAFYRRYYEARNEIAPLVALLAQALSGADAGTRSRLALEIAALAEKHPPAVDKAAEALKALLKQQPGAAEPTAALKRLYGKAEKWYSLLELLKEEVEAQPADAVDRRVELYLEMIPIYRDRLRLDAMVVNTWLSVLTLRPDHAHALAALTERYAARGQWGDLVQVLMQQAERSPDRGQKLALYRRVVALWTEKFNKPASAIPALEKIVEVDADDQGAREQLRELYQKARAWKPLLELMRKESRALAGKERIAQLIRMAKLASDKLPEPAAAIDLWNEVLEVDDHDPDALSALLKLYEAGGRDAGVAEILRRQAARAEDGSKAWADLLERRGLLLRDALGAEAAAVADLERVATAFPRRDGAFIALRDVYVARGDLPAIEALYARRAAPEELLATLVDWAERTDDAAMRVRLYERAVEVARDDLSDPARAADAVEALLRVAPEHERAARWGVDLFRATKRWARLLDMFTRLLGASPSDATAPIAGAAETFGAADVALPEALRWLAEARAVAADQVRDPGLAFAWAARGYEAAPADAAARADLERLADAAGAHAALARLYERRLAGGATGDEALGLLRRSLVLAQRAPARPADARRFAEAILAVDATDAEVERALESLLLEAKDFTALIALLHRRAERAPASARALQLLRIAHLEETQLGDARAAVRSIRRALELAPENLDGARELVRLLEQQGEWAALVAALDGLVGLSAEDARPGLLCRRALVEEERLASPGGALTTYLRAIELDPVNQEAVAGLERLLGADALPKSEIGRLVAPLVAFYEMTEAYQKWAWTLEIAVAADEDRERKQAMLEVLVELYGGPLADPVSACRAALRRFELDAIDYAGRDRLVDLAENVNALPQLIQVARKVLDGIRDVPARRDLLVMVAEAERRRSGDPAVTEPLYREILGLDPLHVGAFRALLEITRQGRRWRDLRDLLADREARLPALRDRVPVLEQIAELDETLLDDRPHAIETLQRLRALEPGHAAALAGLVRLYEATERWAELDDALAEQAKAVPAESDEAAALAARRAALKLTKLGEVAEALDLAEAVIAGRSAHAGARGALELALDDEKGRRRAATVLAPLYEAEGQWRGLVRALEILHAGDEAKDARARLRRIAAVEEERIADAGAALATWRRILEGEPDDANVLAQVERLSLQLEKFSELAALFEALADRRARSDLAGTAGLLGRAAQVREDRLGDDAGAISLWRRVLALDPANPATGEPAAAALARLYRKVGDVRAQVDVMRARLEWTTDRAARRDLLLAIARLEQDELHDAQAAAATYRGLLDTEGDDPEALAALERMAEAGGRHGERLEILERRASVEDDPAARRALRFRMADIAERDLQDRDRAIAPLREILDGAPEDREALRRLARLYAEKGASAEQLEVLERELVLATSAEDRLGLLREVAHLLQGPLGRPGEAFDRYREMLSLAPGDAEALGEVERLFAGDDPVLRPLAAASLDPIYEAAGRWDRLLEALRVRIDNEPAPVDQVPLRRRLARVMHDRLGDSAAAFALLSQTVDDALETDEMPAVLDDYEAVAAALGPEREEEVFARYRKLEPDVLDEGLKSRLLRGIAGHLRRAGDGAGAIRYYGKALELRPDDLDTLSALADLHAEAGDDAALAEILSRHAELVAGDAAAESAKRAAIGAAALRLGRDDEAARAYERVIELSPANAEAKAALDGIYTRKARWSDLAGLLEGRREDLAGDEAVELDFRLSGLLARQLGRPGDALERLRAVLAARPDHEGAIALLRDLSRDDDLGPTAAELLEPICVARADWAGLVRIDGLRARAAEDPARRRKLLLRIARTHEEQLADARAAFDAYGDLLAAFPADAEARAQMARLAESQGLWREFGDRLRDAIEETGGGDEHLDMVRQAAEVFDLRLHDRDAARGYYRKLIEAWPDDAEACALYEAALTRWEAWADLRDDLEERAAVAADLRQRAALLRRSARLTEERLADREAAVRIWRDVLEIDSADAEAAIEAERILRAAARWSDLRDHLAWLAAREADAGRRDDLLLRIADLEREHLDEAEAALDRYADVLARNPRHPAARSAVEGMLSDRDRRARVAEILEPAYRQIDDVGALARVLEVRLEGVEDPRRRAALLDEIADLEARQGRGEREVDVRTRAWLADVSDESAWQRLERVMRERGDLRALAAVLERGATAAPDPETQAALHARRATLLAREIRDVGAAATAWRQALAARPDDTAAFLALETLLEESGAHAELAEVLEKHVEVVADGVERRRLSTRIARIYDGILGDADRAVTWWRAALDAEPGAGDALEALRRLHADRQEWRELADVLAAMIEAAHAPEDIRRLRLESARLHDERLSDPAEAAAQLRGVLDAVPGDAEALARLDALYTREGQHADLVDVLDRRAAAAAKADRDDLAFRAARVVESDLGKVKSAVERYRQILERNPNHEGARGALWSIARGDDQRERALAVLEPILRAGRRWDELIAALNLRFEVEDSAGGRIDLLSEIARIEETERGDRGAAFAALARAFAEDPTNESLQARLEQAARGAGDPGALARVYEKRWADARDAEQRRALAARLADLYDGLADPQRAAEILRETLAASGDDVDLLARLATLLRRHGHHAELADVLARQADVTSSPEQQADLWTVLGVLRQGPLHDAEGAVAAFREAVERVPTHPGALAALREFLRAGDPPAAVLDVLEPLAEGRGDVEELVTIFEARAAREEDPLARAQWFRRIGECAEGRLQDPARAAEAFGRALKDDPLSAESADDFARCARAAGRLSDAAWWLESLLETIDAAAFSDMAMRAARLYAESGPSGVVAAERLYLRVLAADPDHAEGLAALEDLYRARKDAPALARVLERRAHNDDDVDRKLARWREAAELYEAAGDPAAAVAAWKLVRQVDLGNLDVLRRLVQLLDTQGGPADAVETLEALARDSDDGAERITAGLRAAELYAGPLGDLDKAAAALRDVLDAAPDDPSILSALAEVEERRGDHAAVDEALERLAGVTEALPAKLEILQRAARHAAARLKDADRAVAYLGQALDFDPDNRAVLNDLQGLLAAQERWYDLIDVLEKRVAVERRAGDRAAIAAAQAVIADVWIRRLEKPENAAEAVAAILAENPRHVPSHLIMARIHEAAEAWDEAIAALERAAAAGPNPGEVAEIEFRMACVLSARGAFLDQVEGHYRAALDADPTHAEALDALEALLRGRADHAGLARILKTRADIAGDAARRRALLRELADLYLGPLGAPAQAAAPLAALVDAGDRDPALREQLARALIASGRTEEGEALLNGLIDELGKARQNKAVARLQQLLASAAEMRGDVAGASRRLEAAYQIDPSQPAVLAALGRLALAAGDPEKARRYYRSLLLQSFDEKAIGIGKADIYLVLGRLHVEAGETAKARNMFERGLEAAPKHDALKQALAALGR